MAGARRLSRRTERRWGDGHDAIGLGGVGEHLLGAGLRGPGGVLVLDNLEIFRLRDAVRWMALAMGDLWPLAFVGVGIGMIADGWRERRRRPAGAAGAGS